MRETTRDEKAIRRRCTRFLNHHGPPDPRRELFEIAEATPEDMEPDTYGTGEAIASFEAEVAALLGKEAAVFMPSGTMCQQIALRIWAERRGTPNVAMHPRNHLDQPERHGYQRLHGLKPVLVGAVEAPLTLSDIEGISEPLAALLLELPQRELGGLLPDWDDLTAMSAWAKQRGVPVHMDGARLWESQPFYTRSYEEIAGLFDSVYVSFYKMLNGLAGAALAGPASVIAEARIWQRRHGGNLIRLFPYVISARIGMQRHLPRIDEYCRRARDIAAILGSIPGIEVVPDPPHTNMMHVYLRGEAEELHQASLDIAEEEGVYLVHRLQPTARSNWQRFELSVGSAATELRDEEIDRWFRRIVNQGA